MANDKPFVRGRILFDKDVAPFTGATVYVRLENVSRADAAAEVAAEQVLRGVSHRGGEEEALPFELRVESVDERAQYSVRVHVDVDGDGELSPGDYVSPASHPVLTYGQPNHAEVRLERIM
ncbi:MAG TPA: YbaY family lipoprotein [Pyrinomonadaceae bacterium]|nr:YbaY family lipoprotein [Pyrinomonadaceae bacterium]